jgi:hypothetical protein
MATIQDHEKTPGCYPRGFSGKVLEGKGGTGDIGLFGLRSNQEVTTRIRVAYAMTRVIHDGRRLGILINLVHQPFEAIKNPGSSCPLVVDQPNVFLFIGIGA